MQCNSFADIFGGLLPLPPPSACLGGSRTDYGLYRGVSCTIHHDPAVNPVEGGRGHRAFSQDAAEEM